VVFRTLVRSWNGLVRIIAGTPSLAGGHDSLVGRLRNTGSLAV